MSSRKKGNSLPMALLFGLGLPTLALYGLFSLIPYDSMTARWPIGITAEEVHAYQHWFDRRPDTAAEVQVLRFELEAIGPCQDDGGVEYTRRFKGSGTEDSVRVMRMGDDWRITFPAGRPLNGQQQVRLTPATMSSIRRIYALAISSACGAMVGDASIVRLVSCGDDRGIYLAEEVVDPAFVDRYGLAGDVLVDSAHAQVDSILQREVQGALARFGTSADTTAIAADPAASTGLLLQAAGTSFADGASAWFDPGSRRFVAAMGAVEPGSPAAGAGSRALARFLAGAHAQERMRTRAAELAKDSAHIAGVLAGIDAQYASAFVGDTRIGYVRAQLGQERKEFMRRLFHPEPASVFGLSELDEFHTERETLPLDPLLRRYLVGDTIRFTRAKHLIDHLIEVPPGYGVVLEKGARLNMAPGSGLIVNGALHMRGTGLNPVFIRPTDDNATWAGIHVNGTGSTPCTISGLKMSGGGARTTPDDDHRAMLSFHDCVVTMVNCDVREARGPAALGLRRGMLTMRECVVAGGRETLVDLAFVKAAFSRCTFLGEGALQGIRTRSSAMRLDDAVFTRFGTNAIALGDRGRTALRRCTFSANRVAVLATDGAELYADGCTFNENVTALQAERSKGGREGGRVTVFQNTFTTNGSDKRLDAWSLWTTGTGQVPEVVSSAARED